ncbi:MAG: hypothetical protein HKP10_08365 [Kiritimatiellales bacterium]|nr:peptidylprolyl isomerase [Pontiella sp.]NNJ71281.1 hypothetical protein [Kiritimatiellales bacterium]
MRYIFPILTFLSTAWLVAGQTNLAPVQPSSIEIDGYAARVNDRVLTRGEVREALAPMLPELYRAYQGPQLEEELEKAFNRTRDELVQRALIMEAFKARGGQIPDQYVNDEIKRLINERFKGDKALFEKVLTQQKKTRREFMDDIREKLAVGMMVNEEIASRARITPEQVREAYETNRKSYFIPEKVKYSVILLNKGETPEDQAVKVAEAQTILQRLKEGADFAETAKAFSEGSRASDGGSFPWMQPKDVRPELQEALGTLPAGQISDIIETETQLYILKVEARRQSAYKSFEEVRQDLENSLVAQERARLRERWIARLRENHYVVIYE